MIIRDFSRCPRCQSPTTPTKSMNGAQSEYWLECTRCPTYINTYIPQAHQESVHRDSHRVIGNFGAYGTGKTTTSRQELLKHCLITPNANALVGANVTSQYEQTIKRELENDMPLAFVKGVSVQKAYIDLTNNARIMFRPFDNPDKLRSYNLTMYLIIEASEVKAEAYHQLNTRLRNTAAATYLRDENNDPIYQYDSRGVGIPEIEYDWRKGIVESNPDSGWIRTEVLLPSIEIKQYGNIGDSYDQNGVEISPYISSHIASTSTNKFLPKNFIEENSKNKPVWWIARYLYGSFTYAEGLVYPAAANCFVTPFEIPKNWRRIIGFDYGLSDDSVWLFGALDEEEGYLYIYKEVRTKDQDIDALAKLYHDNVTDIPSGGLLTPPIGDPKSLPKRDYNKRSLTDLFIEKGIYMQPGAVAVSARIFRLNSYLNSKRLRIFDTCESLRKELSEYKFPERSLERSAARSDKPVDKNNHGINPLEWIVMALPDDPKNILKGVYDKFGKNVTLSNSSHPKPRTFPHALEDPPEYQQDPDRIFGMAPLSHYGL